MADRKQWIEAIRAAPDDDEPRLVFADWLEEHGSHTDVARAEFIRTQIERANLPAEDPRQSELECRELRLLAEYGSEWFPAGYFPERVRFRRGFVEAVELDTARFAVEAAQLFAVEPIRDVTLTGIAGVKVDPLLSVNELAHGRPVPSSIIECAEWKFVERLQVEDLSPACGELLAELLHTGGLPRLRALHVESVQFGRDVWRKFAQASQLRQLEELVHAHVNESREPAFLTRDSPHANEWPHLKHLRLPKSRFWSLIPYGRTAWWNGLRGLQLFLGDDCDEELAFLDEHLPEGLEEFKLRVSRRGDPAGLRRLMARLKQRPLKRLRLERVPINADLLEGWLDASSCCRLRELSLRQCSLNSRAIRVIAQSTKSNLLERLDLSSYLNRHGGTFSAEELFVSDRLTSLVELCLDSFSFDLLPGESIKDWPSLRVLDVGICTERDLQAVLEKCQSLTWLALSHLGPPIAADLARCIAGMPRLAVLRSQLTDESLTPADVIRSSQSLSWFAGRERKGWPPVDAPLEIRRF